MCSNKEHNCQFCCQKGFERQRPRRYLSTILPKRAVLIVGIAFFRVHFCLSAILKLYNNVIEHFNSYNGVYAFIIFQGKIIANRAS